MYLNCSEQIFDGEGKFDIPIILPTYELDVKEWCMFEEARNRNNPFAFSDFDRRSEQGIHFFQDDHKFEIVWTKPTKHLNKLKAYKCVLSPDFSMYTDFPAAVQIMQAYKRHWVARFWQEQGITVIPTICWSTPESFEWCFDGEPHNSIVAVANVGCTKNKEVRALFDKGFEEMKKRLTPSKILFFTYEKDDCFKYKGDNVEYVNIYKYKNVKVREPVRSMD